MQKYFARIRSIMGPAYDMIRDADLDRKHSKFNRRLIKMMEELGELSEAYLYASSEDNNYKGKTYADVREELADMIVMACDLAAVRLPGEENMTQKEFEQMQLDLIREKIVKWHATTTKTRSP